MKSHHPTSPRDLFMWLFSIIALYITVTVLGKLVFDMIDFSLPDTLDPVYLSFSETVRLPLAFLVVIFPLYVCVTWMLQRDLVRNPEKRDLGIRKWLMYLTLFLTSIAIVIDLVMLMFHYIGGEITNRFLLKILTVFVIAAIVFTLYLWDVRSSVSLLQHAKMKWFVRVSMVLVIVAVVCGFVMAGSPHMQRMRRFDQQRESDLQNIRWQIIYYWQEHEKLPGNLSMLIEPYSYLAIVDPETSQMYEYNILGETRFELCAVFATDSSSQDDMMSRPVAPDEDWTHGPGRTCFEREIDPKEYPPFVKEPIPLTM